MKETYIPMDGDTIYLRHSQIKPDSPTLLFIHGLGDSGLAFEDVFRREQFHDFNILIPDLAGYGRSSASSDYSFNNQVRQLWKVIDIMQEKSGVPIDNIIVAGHSMGGIHAVMMCDSDDKGRIKKAVLIEGSITQYGSYVSYKVMEIVKRGGFDDWFKNVFIENAIGKNLLKKFPSCAHYYASLHFCRKEAFLQNALKIGKVRLSLEGKWKNLAGEIYRNLTIPRVYCYGKDSMCKETGEFLKEYDLQSKEFNTGCHFVMSDKKDEFYNFLRKWSLP